MKILGAYSCWMGWFAAGLIGCPTVPETGRRQLNYIPHGEEAQLGLSSFEKMKQEVPPSKDPAASALVQKVARRVAAIAPLPNAQWEQLKEWLPEARRDYRPHD